VQEQGYTGAIAQNNQSIRLNSNIPKVLYINPESQQDTQDTRKDYEKAIADFTEAIRLKPELALAYNNRGFARLQEKDDKGAMEDFKSAIARKPDLAEAYNNGGFARLLQKN
jgi:tetratricopeptide (TPR) repeat protein